MSLSSNASNVLLAKCRARYGKRLNLQDINTLTNCRSVSEVVSYLKNTPRYGDILGSVDESSMYRRRIEAVLEHGLYEELSTLCRYELQVGGWFSAYFLMRGEIRQIMSFLLQLSAGKPDEFLFSLPEFFLQQSDLNFAALLECRSYSEFLQVMEGTRFYKIIRTLAPAPGKQIDCAVIEHALYNEFYSTIFSIIEKHYSGEALKELDELLSAQVDMNTFAHIYRLKKYYKADTGTIRALLPEHTVHISSRVREELINARDADDVLEIFTQRTAYGRRLSIAVINERGLEAALKMQLERMALRMLRTSVHPTTVLLAYIFLTENETKDIITIVESVFYNLTPDEMRNLITIDEHAEA